MHTSARAPRRFLYILGDLVMLGVSLVIALYWSFETVMVSWKVRLGQPRAPGLDGLVPDGGAGRLRADDLPPRVNPSCAT
jgi:hypothetical protein